jgi:hypothetical protein
LHYPTSRVNIGKIHITEEESEPEVEQHHKTNVGLYTVYAENTTKSDIRIRGEDPAQTIYVADGSVLDPQLGGSYAWFLFYTKQSQGYTYRGE